MLSGDEQDFEQLDLFATRLHKLLEVPHVTEKYMKDFEERAGKEAESVPIPDSEEFDGVRQVGLDYF